MSNSGCVGGREVVGSIAGSCSRIATQLLFLASLARVASVVAIPLLQFREWIEAEVARDCLVVISHGICRVRRGCFVSDFGCRPFWADRVVCVVVAHAVEALQGRMCA